MENGMGASVSIAPTSDLGMRLIGHLERRTGIGIQAHQTLLSLS